MLDVMHLQFLASLQSQSAKQANSGGLVGSGQPRGVRPEPDITLSSSQGRGYGKGIPHYKKKKKKVVRFKLVVAIFRGELGLEIESTSPLGQYHGPSPGRKPEGSILLRAHSTFLALHSEYITYSSREVHLRGHRGRPFIRTV
ncbi:hypothetical protein PUN28_020631 [Cardiocondyla obscurior]|uniref:Uncharacterized protein n=1 Tax=Cardiocondyla obscurior TaxID=286306 RepID=A0AAW2E6T6_9HYME